MGSTAATTVGFGPTYGHARQHAADSTSAWRKQNPSAPVGLLEAQLRADAAMIGRASQSSIGFAFGDEQPASIAVDCTRTVDVAVTVGSDRETHYLSRILRPATISDQVAGYAFALVIED